MDSKAAYTLGQIISKYDIIRHTLKKKKKLLVLRQKLKTEKVDKYLKD